MGSLLVPTKITIHCTDTKDGSHVSLDAIRENHIARGYGDIGYHFVIQPDGLLESGRAVTQVGAHVARHNSGNIGIALAGARFFTFYQFRTLRRQIENLCNLHSIKPWDICMHYEFDTAQEQGKTCPNIELKKFLCFYYSGNLDAISGYLIENKNSGTLN